MNRLYSVGPDQYFNPAAFAVPPAGTLGNTGRGAFIGPNLRTFDLAAVKKTRLTRLLGDSAILQIRVEAFNLFNRANFAPPALTAFAGTATTEAPLSTFGRIRSTVTSVAADSAWDYGWRFKIWNLPIVKGPDLYRDLVIDSGIRRALWSGLELVSNL